jgi:hypothetical protein
VSVSELAEKLIWENPARIFSLIAVHFPERNEMEREPARRGTSGTNEVSDLVSFQSPKIL